MMLLLKDAFDKSFQRLAVLVTEMCTSRRGCLIKKNVSSWGLWSHCLLLLVYKL
jgi:hypothetical protein